MFKNYLNSSLERVFSNKNDLGFWDDKSDTIIESLFHDEQWNWEFRPSNNNRYSLFCLSMILLSKELYQINTNQYDDKIKKFLFKIKSIEGTLTASDLTYGGLLALILGERIYRIQLITEKTHTLLNENLIRLRKSKDNHDFLLLMATFFYYQQFPSDELVANILKVQERLINALNRNCYFDTGDIRASYHQRVMYSLWGLIFTSHFNNSASVKGFSKRIINYFVNHRKLWDNSFIWHRPMYSIKYYGIKVPVYNKKSSNYLFECHQTFFVNSINFYQYIFNDSGAFIKEKEEAMGWIFGGNRNTTNLVELTGLSLPSRIMTTDGLYFVEGEKYKGSYEIGSYILALSSF